LYYSRYEAAETESTIRLPKNKDGNEYTMNSMDKAQQNVVMAAVYAILRFLRNDKGYEPFRATIMGCGGTGKSYIINTILTIVRKMTRSNTTLLIAAPSGSAAFNVQGSTLHHLLGISVKRPEDKMSDKVQQKLLKQFESVLCLIIDERSMLSSRVLAAAERNLRQTVYNGQNSQEIWGGIPAVILFGDDYQLWPVIDEEITSKEKIIPTNKQNEAQLLCRWGTYLFTNVMTESVFLLTKNYRVKSDQFQDLLARLRVGASTAGDAKRITDLHLSYYEGDSTFMKNLKQDPKTMWLYAKNEDKDKTNIDMLIQTSKTNNVPIARLFCHYETNRTNLQQQPKICVSHFDKRTYDTSGYIQREYPA
jgi:hypothetical protein